MSARLNTLLNGELQDFTKVIAVLLIPCLMPIPTYLFLLGWTYNLIFILDRGWLWALLIPKKITKHIHVTHNTRGRYGDKKIRQYTVQTLI